MASFTLGAAGNAYGGPLLGFAGAVVGSYIDSLIFGSGGGVVNEQPSLADSGRAADSPGAAIARIWGEQNRVGTTLAWLGPRIETKHAEEIESGKLDSGPTATNIAKTYSRDLMLIVGATGHGGPFVSFPRIWIGPKLFYDASASPAFTRAADVRFALGTLTQTPDAMIEAVEGDKGLKAENVVKL